MDTTEAAAASPDDIRERITGLLDQVDQAVNEFDEAVSEAATEAAYQDGLNDALGELLAYREQLTAAGTEQMDQSYLDGLDDAIATVRQAGALDHTTATDADTSAGEAAAADESTKSAAADDSHDDTDGM